jgi:hypothetical protein
LKKIIEGEYEIFLSASASGRKQPLVKLSGEWLLYPNTSHSDVNI